MNLSYRQTKLTKKMKVSKALFTSFYLNGHSVYDCIFTASKVRTAYKINTAI